MNSTLWILLKQKTSFSNSSRYKKGSPNPFVGVKSDWNTHVKARSTSIIHFIRVAQINERLYGSLLQGRIVPMHFLVSHFITVCLFCLILFHGTINWELTGILWIATLSGSFGWLLVLWLMGHYYTKSKHFIMTWKEAEWSYHYNPFEKKLMRRFYRSCRPVEFRTTSGVKRFRPILVIRYLHFITWLLARALLINRKIDMSDPDWSQQ